MPVTPERKADLSRRASGKALELAALEERKADLTRQLARALAIQAWQPRAFEHGPCRFGFIGSQPARGDWPLETWQAHLTLGNGEDIKAPLADVPLELIPEHIKARPEFKRRVKHKESS